MKLFSLYLLSFVTLAGCANSRKEEFDKNNKRSPFKSITVRDPELRKNMNGSASDAEKDAILKNLHYQVSFAAKNCEQGVTAEDKTLELKPVTESNADTTFKVKTGCEYIVSMVYIDKTDSSNSKELLKSDGKTINLTKEDLKKDKPTARVLLYATTEGSKYWNTKEPIATPTESDVGVHPEIAGSGGANELTLIPCMKAEPSDGEAAANCLTEFQKSVVQQSQKYSAQWNYQTLVKLITDVDFEKPDSNSEYDTALFCTNLSATLLNVTTSPIAYCNALENKKCEESIDVEIFKFLRDHFAKPASKYKKTELSKSICKR